MRLLLAACLLVCVGPTPAQDAIPIGDPEGLPAKRREVERHGITWTFDKPYVVGAFANGDPWVIGPVKVVAISPETTVADGRALHGSMVDPDPSTENQGYDGGLYGNGTNERYVAKLNVAVGLSAKAPLRLQAGQSLVSVESRPKTDAPPTLLRASVLTVLARKPAPDAFRPPYVKGDAATKKPRFRVADLDFRALQKLAPVGDVPLIESVTRRFEKLWLDHVPAWVARYMHPLENMPDYGRDIAALVGSAGLMLNLDLPKKRKQELLVHFTQLGIDNHAKLLAGCRWHGLGGHGHGRKLPILVAGRVLGDERMLAVGKDYVSKPKQAGGNGGWFGEDTQTFYVRRTGDREWNWGFGNYTEEHEDLPEWGFAHADSPDRDDHRWEGNPYRRCCTANGWVAQCLTVRAMGLVDEWNHPAWFDYMDRYQQHEHAEDWHRSWVPWHPAMWAAYRDKF